MRKELIVLCLALLCFESLGQERSTRRRSASSGSGSSGNSESFHNGSVFSSQQECDDSGCPCCIYLREGRFLCRTHNALMPNVIQRWGHMEEITVQSVSFRVYNATRRQKQSIEEILSVLPVYYLEVVSKNIRVGNPMTGGIRTSTSAIDTRRPNAENAVWTGEQLGERIGGGSRRCLDSDSDYDQIIIHPLAFQAPYGNPRLTLLHEIGHFINKNYRIAESYQTSHRTEFDAYRAEYPGDSDSDEEVIAQGIMYYYHRKNWPGSRATDADGVWVNPDFPLWLKTIVMADIASRS